MDGGKCTLDQEKINKLLPTWRSGKNKNKKPSLALVLSVSSTASRGQDGQTLPCSSDPPKRTPGWRERLEILSRDEHRRLISAQPVKVSPGAGNESGVYLMGAK